MGQNLQRESLGITKAAFLQAKSGSSCQSTNQRKYQRLASFFLDILISDRKDATYYTSLMTPVVIPSYKVIYVTTMSGLVGLILRLKCTLAASYAAPW